DHEKILADRLDSVLPALIVPERFPVPGHRVENRAGETAAGLLHKEQLLADLGVPEFRTRREPLSAPLPRIPRNIKSQQLHEFCAPAPSHGLAQVGPCPLKVRVQSLARHKWPQDISCAFTDAVHFGIAHKLLNDKGRLAPHPL